MKKLFISTAIIGLLGIAHLVTAAPTSTIVQNLKISALGSSGQPCLVIFDSSGLVATSTCGGSASIIFQANGGGFVTTSTINFQQGSNITITTSSNGTYTITGSAGGGGGVTTSSPFSAGFIPYATSGVSITNSNIFQASTTNIGIGTQTPQKALQVGSSTNFAGSGSGIGIGASGAGGLYLTVDGDQYENEISSARVKVGPTTITPMDFITGNQIRTTIDTSGNFGIGTQFPSSTLHVIGSIIASLNVTVQSLLSVLTANVSGTLTVAGSSTLQGVTFTNATGTGNLQVATLNSTGNANVSGTLNVTGATGLQGVTFANATGTGNLQTNTFKATGAANLSSTLAVTGALDSQGGLTFTTATGTNLTVTGVASTSQEFVNSSTITQFTLGTSTMVNGYGPNVTTTNSVLNPISTYSISGATTGNNYGVSSGVKYWCGSDALASANNPNAESCTIPKSGILTHIALFSLVTPTASYTGNVTTSISIGGGATTTICTTLKFGTTTSSCQVSGLNLPVAAGQLLDISHVFATTPAGTSTSAYEHFTAIIQTTSTQ